MLWVLWAPVWVGAAASNQDRVIEEIAAFIEMNGDKAAAKAVRDGYNADPKRIRFGPVQDNDSAQTDVTGDHRTVLNTSAINQVLNSRGFDRYQQTAEWARTVQHELEHQRQDANAWRGAYWRHALGGEHPCEKEAWQRGFQANYNWMRRLANLASDPAPNAEERAAAARKLEILAKIFQDYKRNYRASYGPVRITIPGGTTVSLDEAIAEASQLEKKARELIALAETSVSRPLNEPPEGRVGTYRGTFSGDASGTITFVLRGKVLGGEYQGREHRRGASINGAAPEPMVKYDPATGEFSALFMGARSDPAGEGLGMLLNFKAKGKVLREKITGSWSFETYEKIVFRGIFEARK